MKIYLFWWHSLHKGIKVNKFNILISFTFIKFIYFPSSDRMEACLVSYIHHSMKVRTVRCKMNNTYIHINKIFAGCHYYKLFFGAKFLDLKKTPQYFIGGHCVLCFVWGENTDKFVKIYLILFHLQN